MTEKFTAKRNFSLLYCVGLISGSIIGSGIFMTPGSILRNSGSVGASLIIWVASSVISFCSALSYAEIALLLKESGGEYRFIDQKVVGRLAASTLSSRLKFE